MRLHSFVTLPLLALVSLAVKAVPQAYQNDAVVQTYELGSAVTIVTTTISIKALKDQPGEYYLPFKKDSIAWEISVGKNNLGSLKPVVLDGLVAIPIPAGLTRKDQTGSIVLKEHLAHQSTPLPETIKQDDPQLLQYSTERSYPESAYLTKKLNIKYRAPRKILSHSKTPQLYLPEESTSKPFKLLGTALNLGPFHNVPASYNGQDFKQAPLTIHYETAEPILAIKTLQRHAEVGVWGSNLNIEDKITLTNVGPKLKGQFGRLDFQAARFRDSFPAQILREFTYPLTEGAVDPYYYDSIGNVSTSHFRSAPLRGGPAIIEITPRFPLLGGWSFEFTVGWDSDLGRWLKNVGRDKMVLAVPFLSGLKGVLVEEAELIVTLPEGAKDIKVQAPFEVDSQSESIHKTYLDSTGRPRIILKKSLCSELHEQNIYIEYSYPFYAIFQKPAVVTLASLLGFAIYWLVKRLDTSIASPAILKTKTD